MIIIHLQHHTDGSSGISLTILIGSDFMSQLTIVDRINVLSVASQIQSVALPASLREVLQLIALRFFLVPVFIRLSNGCQVGPVCRIGIEAAARIVQGIQPEYHGIILYIIIGGYFCCIRTICQTSVLSCSHIQLKCSFLLWNNRRIGQSALGQSHVIPVVTVESESLIEAFTSQFC